MSGAYFQRDNPSFEAHLEERTAAGAAGFFLSRLRPGLRVLDIGCGPGTITLGLAEALAPGEVVGVDVQPALVERARDLAAARGLTNVRFAVADCYTLPFEDASFDAALLHMVVMHLAEPVRALLETRRVLRPEGMVGLRDADLETTVRWPSSPEWQRFLALRRRGHESQGSDMAIARKHRELLLAAGFVRAESGAVTDGAGTPEETRRRAAWLKAQLVGSARVALANGWTDQPGVDAIAGDLDAWAERPDAMFFTVVCETVGWVRA